MSSQKDSFKKCLDSFLADHKRNGRRLLEALLESFDGSGSEKPVDVNLDLLVRIAATQAAKLNPESPLDQKQVRDTFLDLFRRFEDKRLGKRILGRRGHQTRFRFNFSSTDSWGPSALKTALSELAIGPLSGDENSSLSIFLAPPTTEPGPPLKRDDVMSRLRAHGDEIHQLGVSALSLFGSVARDEARPDSDVDLLATFDAPITSDRFFGAKFFLEDLLGKRIDLVTESALRDRVRKSIESELIRVA